MKRCTPYALEFAGGEGEDSKFYEKKNEEEEVQ
jgi:hypothetical protein